MLMGWGIILFIIIIYLMKRKNQTICNATPVAAPVNSSLERTITGETGGNNPITTEVQSDHHYHHHYIFDWSMVVGSEGKVSHFYLVLLLFELIMLVFYRDNIKHLLVIHLKSIRSFCNLNYALQ